MNGSAKLEAYRSFYDQGKSAYNQGDLPLARESFLKAAELANEISVSSEAYDVRMEYHRLAQKILTFVKTNCIKKAPVESSVADSSQGGVPAFRAENRQNAVTFEQVAGLEQVKDQIRFKVLAPASHPELAKIYEIDAGGKILLYGPPGTGKTFVARAIAGEVDAAFFAVNCQDLISKFMGDSSKQLDSLFEEAQKNERAIIFFDEFDSVASRREDGTGGVDAEMARFVATFLTKVDGFKKSETNKMLLLIAATNRPWALDSAMLRGGRFDTQIYVGLPDQSAREFLVKKTLEKLPLDQNVDLGSIASSLSGYGGGDIVSACDKIKLEAYKRAVQSGERENITQDDCRNVVRSLRNVITAEELAKFAAYRRGERIR